MAVTVTVTAFTAFRGSPEHPLNASNTGHEIPSVARSGPGTGPFSVFQNTNGPVSGLNPIRTTVNPGHLAEKAPVVTEHGQSVDDGGRAAAGKSI
jgi:hypothetical protein